MTRVLVFGTSWLGAEVVRGLVAEGFEVAAITTSSDDRTVEACRALCLPFAAKLDKVPLVGADFPWRPDLTVSAHSFRLIPAWVRDWSRFGSIGYHPSRLPAFKGRGAVVAAVTAGARMTGGSVYWLTDQIDGGPVVAAAGRRFQETVQILPNETAPELWRRALAPLGRDLLVSASAAILR